MASRTRFGSAKTGRAGNGVPQLYWYQSIPGVSVRIRQPGRAKLGGRHNFIGAKTYRKPSYHLLTIKQSPQESLRSYVQRFNAESLKVDVLDEKFVVTAFIVGL